MVQLPMKLLMRENLKCPGRGPLFFGGLADLREAF
jgi:hypothetical protein